MKIKMKSILGTIFASVLFALVATAGVGGWDGDSWVYDQSGHVAVQLSRESGSLDVLNSSFKSVVTSAASGVYSRFMSLGSSEPASVSTLPVGVILVVF